MLVTESQYLVQSDGCRQPQPQSRVGPAGWLAQPTQAPQISSPATYAVRVDLSLLSCHLLSRDLGDDFRGPLQQDFRFYAREEIKQTSDRSRPSRLVTCT